MYRSYRWPDVGSLDPCEVAHNILQGESPALFWPLLVTALKCTHAHRLAHVHSFKTKSQNESNIGGFIMKDHRPLPSCGCHCTFQNQQFSPIQWNTFIFRDNIIAHSKMKIQYQVSFLICWHNVDIRHPFWIPAMTDKLSHPYTSLPLSCFSKCIFLGYSESC